MPSGSGGIEDAETTSGATDDSSTLPEFVQVNLDITVPVYVSDALQVQISWGEKSLTAAWVQDESWNATDNFFANTEYPLSVDFLDGNGGLILASYEASFRIGSGTSETYRITADQFETSQYDNDNDGVSNLEDTSATVSGAVYLY